MTPDAIILDGTSDPRELWLEVLDSEELVQLLLERNAENLRQCTIDGTPFASGPLNQLFGLYGSNDEADAVLNGTLDITNQSQGTQSGYINRPMLQRRNPTTK